MNDYRALQVSIDCKIGTKVIKWFDKLKLSPSFYSLVDSPPSRQGLKLV